jgi:hypothetical protein
MVPRRSTVDPRQERRMTPLKPCPFCLTEGAKLIELWDTFDAGHIAHIHCEHCGADGPSVYGEMGANPTIMRARSMWNGRAAPYVAGARTMTAQPPATESEAQTPDR